MSAPIPVDIESGDQWQVRYEGLSGNEVTKTGNKVQMVWLAKQRREFGAILERRPIIVGAWEVVDPDNPDPEPVDKGYSDIMSDGGMDPRNRPGSDEADE